MISETLLILLWPALLMGLFSGAHCIGMCGGIVCALSYSCQKKDDHQWSVFILQLAYSLGRICTYSMLGAATGWFGYLLAGYSGSQGTFYIRFLSAVLVILTGCYIAGWWRWMTPIEVVGKRLWQPVSKLTRHLLPVTRFSQAFMLGGLWGLLPCGMVYSAMLFSLGAQSPLASAFVMFIFGLGTLPALLLAGSVMRGYQQYLASDWVKQISGATLILFGGMMIWLLLNSVAHHPLSCHAV